MAERTIPDPNPNPETAAFWEAANEGRFLIKSCGDCGKPHWYPRAVCPHCFSANTTWRPASGRGTIYSYSVTRRIAAPYAIAYVTLEEGPTMMTNIVDCDLDGLAIGRKVELVFKSSQGGQAVPMFRPVG
jgi:uncharacterized protein